MTQIGVFALFTTPPLQHQPPVVGNTCVLRCVTVRTQHTRTHTGSAGMHAHAAAAVQGAEVSREVQLSCGEHTDVCGRGVDALLCARWSLERDLSPLSCVVGCLLLLR